MDQITSEQLNTLAQQFLDMGNALLAYRENNPALPANINTQLEQLQNALFDKAGQLATMAAIVSGQEAASAVNSLTQVNAQITQSIQGLENVQKVINIAAAALHVAVAVISMNPRDIINAVGGLAAAAGVNIAG
jgi:cob(I)alamin adenosyltransferase